MVADEFFLFISSCVSTMNIERYISFDVLLSLFCDCFIIIIIIIFCFLVYFRVMIFEALLMMRDRSCTPS